jgi:hypothetical protein
MKYFDKSGRAVDEQTALDHRGTIRDGYRMTVPLNMRDSSSEWDGTKVVHALTDADIRRETRDQFVPLTDDEKCERIDRVNAKLTDAWKNPTPLADTRTTVTVDNSDGADNSNNSNSADGVDVYDRYDQRLLDAWRNQA